MKIESKGIEITEIPVFDSITVTPEGIILIGGGFYLTGELMAHHLFRADALALRDALTAALDAQEKMPDGTPASAAPRVFDSNSAEPGPEVIKVEDCDGSCWYRGENDWSLRPGGIGESWEAVLEYAPLTDVTND